MYFLDITSTEQMLQFDNEPEAMQSFYQTALECTLYLDDEPIAEKYWIEGEDGMILEEVIYEEAEYVTL